MFRRAIEAARKLGNRHAFDSLRETEVMPGPKATAEDIRELARLASASFGHPVGRNATFQLWRFSVGSAADARRSSFAEKARLHPPVRTKVLHAGLMDEKQIRCVGSAYNLCFWATK